MTEATESVDVDCRIASVRFPTNRKSLLGIVDVALTISGVEITICGLQVVRRKDIIKIIAPEYKDHNGINKSVLMVPEVINDQLVELIMDLFVEVENVPSVH